MPKSDIADNIGIVSQHPFIFAGSIKDNLLYSINARREAHGVQRGRPPLPGRNHRRGAAGRAFRRHPALRPQFRLQEGPQGESGQEGDPHPRGLSRRPRRGPGRFRGIFDPSRYLYTVPWPRTSCSAPPEREDLAPENLAGNPGSSVSCTTAASRCFCSRSGRTGQPHGGHPENVPSPEAIFFERTPSRRRNSRSTGTWPPGSAGSGCTSSRRKTSDGF